MAEEAKTDTADAKPAVDTVDQRDVRPLLSIKEAAAALTTSSQWLKYWLVANPVDTAGVPFYVKMGSRFKFQPTDIDRIVAHLRELEAVRLGPSVKAKFA